MARFQLVENFLILMLAANVSMNLSLNKHIDTNTVELLQIERLKNEILKQLKITKRPPRSSTNHIVLPQPLQTDLLDDDVDDEENEVRIVLLPKPNSNKDKLQFLFEVKENICDGKEISDAVFGIYRNKLKTTNHSVLWTLSINNASTKQKVVDKTMFGWMKFDLSGKVSRCRSGILSVQLTCKSCSSTNFFRTDSGVYAPYLVLRTSKRKLKRFPRSLCVPKNSCCLRSLYLNFTEIKWNHFVVAPNGLLIKFCSGKCMKKEKTFPSTAPCCVATKTKPTYLTLNINGNIFQRKINLIATACGCHDNVGDIGDIA